MIGRKEKKRECRDRGERQKEEKEKQMRKLGEKKGEEREKREEKKKEKQIEQCKGSTAPPPDAFPSQKLGNNMTPIMGRLGKNTTPTHGDPEKLIQRRQRNPSEDSRTSSIHPMRTSSTHYEKKNLQKRRIQRQQNHHL